MEYTYIGWCREGASDKVWVCIKLNGDRWGGSYVTAWGRRGKKLQYKVFDHRNEWDMETLIRSKSKKGYASVSEGYLTEVYPEFDTDLKQLAFWATLSV